MEADEVLERGFRDSAVGQALLDSSGRFLQVNRALCALLGRTEPELLALTLTDITQQSDRGVQRVHLEDMTLSVIDNFSARRQYLQADGTVIFANMTISALRADDGSLEYLLMQVFNATEETLIDETFRLLAAHGSDVLIRTDPDGVVQWISPTVQRVTGWRPEQLLGVPLNGLIHPEDRASALLLSLPEPGRFTARVMHADGSFTQHVFHVDPIPGPDTSILGRVATMRVDCG